MQSVDQNETVLEQGSIDAPAATVINVIPHKDELFQSASPKRTRKKSDRRPRLAKVVNEYNQQPESELPDEDKKEIEPGSEGKIKGVDQETAGEYEQNGLATPYEFLTERTPSIRKIFFPRMACRTATFALSILYIIAFVILIGYNYSKEQTSITWNCSLYQLQNKYYPRLNNNYELWRVVVSAFFHSNIAHFFLDLFALQIYGYFVEWYYGTKPFLLTLLATILYSHVLAAVLQKTSVSTTSSAIFMAIAALKVYFLWEYRNYKKLYDRRSFLYILLILIVGINFIPIFVVNNVDYSAHLGGLITGGLVGLFLVKKKMEEPSKMDLALKWGSLVLLVCSFVVLVALVFSGKNMDNTYLAAQIESQCAKNSP